MQNLSYTKSVTLTEELSKIDELRKELLLYPLSPVEELQLQWEAELERIHYLLALNGIAVSKEHIQSFLTPIGTKTPHPHENLILSFKKAHDYLYHHWLVTKKSVTTDDLIVFYNEIFKGTFQIDTNTLETSLRYIQVNPEHPVIQAALAQILILTLNPFSDYNEQFSQLVFLLFLYKYGYDMKRLPIYAQYFYHNISSYKDLILKTTRQQNVTMWLEYVASAVIHQLQKTVQMLKSNREEISFNQDMFDLNDRQHAILTLFSMPDAKITNKIVQRKFKVSQITASRDLAKLSSLGIIFSIGKGRSTYYTKV